MRAVRALAVIGVDVLAEQRDLARAGATRRRASASTAATGRRDFGAARVGHDAEGAELVAAFLDGQEGGDAPAARGGVRQVVELVLGGEIGLDHRAAGAAGAGHHLRQAVVGLRAEHDVDVRRAAR